MSGFYTVRMPATAITAQIDIFEIVPASTKPCIIHSIHLGQSSEIADAQEEMLVISLKHGSTTSGSGGSTATPRPRDISIGAASFAAEYGNTTKATAGTIITLEDYYWNVRTPLDIIFTEAEYIWLPASTRFTVELATTPADSITLGGFIVVQELG